MEDRTEIKDHRNLRARMDNTVGVFVCLCFVCLCVLVFVWLCFVCLCFLVFVCLCFVCLCFLCCVCLCFVFVCYTAGNTTAFDTTVTVTTERFNPAGT